MPCPSHRPWLDHWYFTSFGINSFDSYSYVYLNFSKATEYNEIFSDVQTRENEVNIQSFG
jgi:hypothetical protein